MDCDTTVPGLWHRCLAGGRQEIAAPGTRLAIPGPVDMLPK